MDVVGGVAAWPLGPTSVANISVCGVLANVSDTLISGLPLGTVKSNVLIWPGWKKPLRPFPPIRVPEKLGLAAVTSDRSVTGTIVVSLLPETTRSWLLSPPELGSVTFR